MRRTILVLLVVGCLVVTACAKEDAATTGTTATGGSPATTTSPAPPGPKTSFRGEGIYRVGADIAPGTYVSAGPTGSGSCYWARLSNLSGDDNLLANDISEGPSTVEVLESDVALQTKGCQQWKLAE